MKQVICRCNCESSFNFFFTLLLSYLNVVVIDFDYGFSSDLWFCANSFPREGFSAIMIFI